MLDLLQEKGVLLKQSLGLRNRERSGQFVVESPTTRHVVLELVVGRGNALAQMMDEPVIPEVLNLVTDKGHGRNRASMIEILVEYRDRDDVRQVLEALTDDPEVAKEASHALALKRVRRRPGRKKRRKR